MNKKFRYSILLYLFFSFFIIPHTFAQISLKDLIMGKRDSVPLFNVADNAYNKEFKRVVGVYSSRLENALESNDEKAITLNYYNLAWWYLYHQDFDDALENFIEATKYKGAPFEMINSYGIASNIYSWTGEHELAMEYAQKALAVSEQDSIPIYFKAQARMYVGDAYRYANQLKQYYENYKLAGEYIIESRKLGQMDFSSSIALLYLLDSSDSVTILDYAFSIKYQYERIPEDQRRLFVLSLYKLADSFIKLKDYEREQEKKVLLFVAGLLLLGVISFFLFMQNRSKKKMNEKLQALNEQLKSENLLKTNILAILNHDLRHPVARWVNYLQLTERDPSAISPEMAANTSRKSLNISLNLLRNIDELLIWCKDQMQERPLELGNVEVKDLFEDIRVFFQYEDKVDFTFKDAENLTLKTSGSHLNIIMRNLTANAINAQQDEEKPIVFWEATRENNKTILSIRDNGNGIPDEDMRRFNTQTEKPVHRKGLGLQIVLDIARTINCKIEVSRPEGRGTIFRLIFEGE